MSKDRLTICKNYVCEDHPCKKNKVAKHKKICQTCKSYEPRAKIKHENRKKTELERVREKEWKNE